MRLARSARTGVALGGLLLAAACVGDIVDRRLNTTYEAADAPRPTAREAALHDALFLVDLHADTMMWDRDPLARAGHGHVDLPRLVEGNVAVQVFAAVTRTLAKRDPPEGATLIEGATTCVDGTGLNQTGWLQVAQLRPPETWLDLEARALHQAARLRRFVAAAEARHEADPAQPYLAQILDADDLRRVVAARRTGAPVVGTLMALEGAHWIGGPDAGPAEIRADLQTLFDAGFRMVAPTHRFDNALAASSEGCNQRAGLTADGVAFLDAAEGLGMILDLAHASDRTIDEATAARAGPVVVSHTGIRRSCPRAEGCDVERNLGDAQIRAVARTGGIVAIGYWPEVVGPGIAGIARAFRDAHAVLADPAFVAEMRAIRPRYDPMDHLALGSDFDGAVTTPFDVAGLPLVTAALARVVDEAGRPMFDERALRKIAGANACRVFATRLPGGGRDVAAEICAPLLDGPAVAAR